MVKLSIIIPLFNSEKYINHCIKSCRRQNINKNIYEIICIDDGSTDSSSDIIKNSQKEHCNIVLIHKENGGVSSARNAGIEIAKGKYLLFVDSDDTIKEYSLKEIIVELGKSNVEMMILNSYVSENDKKIISYKFPEGYTGEILSGIELFKNHYSRGSVCGVVFKKTFLKGFNLRFSESVMNGEDSLFMTMCFLYAKDVKHFDLDFYAITKREESASSVWNIKKIYNMLDSLDVISEFIKKNSLSKIQLAMLNIRAYGTISNALFYFASLHELKRYPQIRSKIRKNNLFPIKTYGINHFKYKIILLNFSVDIFYMLFIFRQLYFDLYRKVLLT